MASSDKLSIKNLLFSKALQNYVPDAPGHKTYLCTDCGDKYIFESSYNMHINRKSVKITYMCRHCGQLKIFLNRCKLLSHIRSHSFKTATINVSDLNIEPLPLEYYSVQPTITPSPHDNVKNKTPENTNKNIIGTVFKNCCPDCKKELSSSGILYQDRANHYMKVSDDMTCYSCPVCLYSLPTTCALKAHIRIHLVKPPFICPECGVTLPQKGIIYPFNHDCEGFKTMRVTTRLKCLKNNSCKNFHPNEYRDHMKKHIIKVFKCSSCPRIWCNEYPKEKHLPCKSQEYIDCFKCPICPNKLVSGPKLDRHLNNHFNSNLNVMESQVYPCRLCPSIYTQVETLLSHHIKNHGALKELIESALANNTIKSKEVCVVVKRCEKCKRNFKYRCPFDEIKSLPNECPFRCSSAKVKCFVCKIAINEQWENIKRHFIALHKEHKCVDVKVNLKRLQPGTNKQIMQSTKQATKKFKSAFHSNLAQEAINNNFKCNLCDKNFINKVELEKHIVSHRDLAMAYQCLECGQSFAVKPSFTTHLMMMHQICDVDIYISEKQCFNELAFSKNQKNDDPINNEPVQENQCKICREQFSDSVTLEKHFRVHGMAFLKENTNKSPN